MNKESYEQASRELERELLELTPAELKDFLWERRDALTLDARPFTAYMRRKCREKSLLLQNVFLAADISESYGYKLISGEKHTRQRDVILRLCLGAKFRPEEVREALTLYGMAPLYGRFPRDAVLLVVFRNGIRDIAEVNRLLRENGQTPLIRDYS